MPVEPTYEMRTETFAVVNALPLRLSFTPDAIREHFAAENSPESAAVANLTDAELSALGAAALSADVLYEAFHAALVAAVREQRS